MSPYKWTILKSTHIMWYQELWLCLLFLVDLALYIQAIYILALLILFFKFKYRYFIVFKLKYLYFLVIIFLLLISQHLILLQNFFQLFYIHSIFRFWMFTFYSTKSTRRWGRMEIAHLCQKAPSTPTTNITFLYICKVT